MNRFRLPLLIALLALGLPAVARAQVFVPSPGVELGGSVSLAPVTGADGLSAPLFAGPGGPGIDINAHGVAGGKTATDVNNLQIGFDYLRPYWTSRDFTLVVPNALAPNFPLLGDAGHVDDQFALAPRLNYKYDIGASDFSVNASGTFLNLNGSLHRTVVGPAGGQGDLNATSALTIVSTNVPEFSTRVYYGDWIDKNSCLCCDWLQDVAIDVGIGARYSSISQNYNSSLSNTAPAGVNSSHRYSTQSFQGIGLTTRLDIQIPCKNNWIVFSNLRGSILVGDNHQDSVLDVVLAGVPGVSSEIYQTKTDYIPVGEWELGVEWGHNLGNALRTDTPPPLFTIRVAFAAQAWGQVGPLSAGSLQGFSASNMYLVGAHVLAGFHR